MNFRLSRRTIYVIAAAGVAGGLLQIVTGQPATSGEATDAVNATPSPSAQVARAGESAPRVERSRPARPAEANLLASLTHRTAQTPDDGNLFAAHSWYVAPPPPLPPPPAPVAPTAPPLQFTFIGKYGQGGGETVYFLARGDRVYDVKQGDLVDGIYRVDGVANGQLTFIYTPLDLRQTLSIDGDS